MFSDLIEFPFLIAASNTYLGLKIGWTFGASLFGAIFSFAIIKPISRILPPKWGGGYFGPKENCTAQSAATTAGGLSAGFVSGIPAMYKLGLMTNPRDDAAALFLFAISAAFYGLFFAVPLRDHFVVKQDLTFPTPRAAATTIISLHSTVEGEKEAMKKRARKRGKLGGRVRKLWIFGEKFGNQNRWYVFHG